MCHFPASTEFFGLSFSPYTLSIRNKLEKFYFILKEKLLGELESLLIGKLNVSQLEQCQTQFLKGC